ncbi:MAG: periplasmic binding protein/LacI transcriptional regulator [Actinomycetia bacterium]|nr:periplasmic binding protein/LacI transcriptional regulator [Actinomycetes bacterium]
MNREPPKRQGHVDIRDVARAAGVSTATVSRALSGRGYASDDARRKVAAASRRLGYQPAAPGRSLRTTRSMTIGLLVPDLADPVYLPFLRGVEHAAQQHGYVVVVADARSSTTLERRQLDRLYAQRVDALVLAGSPRDRAYLRRLQRAGLMVVDPEGPNGPSDIRRTTEAHATTSLCEHLADLGHSRIAYVTRGAPRGRTAQRRSRAVIDSCRKVGIAAKPVLLGARREPDDVGDMLAGLVRSRKPVTAVVCGAHSLAPLLLRAKSAAGIHVPDECSFVTYGDSDWAAAYRPALSVVRRDLYARATAITTHLIAQLDGHDPHVTDPDAHRVEFVPRDSVARARS